MTTLAKVSVIAALMILQGLLFSSGLEVTLNLNVSINCSANLQNLTNRLEEEIEQVYKSANFSINTVKTDNATCEDSMLYKAAVNLSFNDSGILSGNVIEGVFEDALKNGTFSNLTESNTNFTITFAGSSTSSSVVTSTPESSTTSPTTTTSTSTPSSSVVASPSGSSTTTIVVTSTPESSSISPTSTTSTSTPSSSVVTSTPGPAVYLILLVIINCSGDRLNALNVTLQKDIKDIYTREGFPVKSVITQSISCNTALNSTLELSFYSGIPSGKTIKKVFQDALKGGKITSLTESNTTYTITFTGVTLTYSPKEGQCQTVCCDGAGGAITLERVCTPTDRCKGIEPDEKEEEGHCPTESKGTCAETCDDGGGSGGIHNSPSYALVTLLAIATFTKTILF